MLQNWTSLLVESIPRNDNIPASFRQLASFERRFSLLHDVHNKSRLSTALRNIQRRWYLQKMFNPKTTKNSSLLNMQSMRIKVRSSLSLGE
jgi:hypothetical protein